jgi:hypothetical protein
VRFAHRLAAGDVLFPLSVFLVREAKMGMAKLVFRSLAATGLTLSLLVASVSIASAFSPRLPQVIFNSAGLQAYFNSKGEVINCLANQVDGQVWNASVSGNTTFTLMIELTTSNATQNAIGVYNIAPVPNPPLFNIFPGLASAGWFATAHFAGSNLTVTLFDQNAVIQGQITYFGVTPNNFGFYLTGPGVPLLVQGGVWYSEDNRNAFIPKVLTYEGTGNNAGDWWQCFEDSDSFQAASDFDDVVLLMQSVVPTPTNTSTWGKVKSLYRQ